MFTSTDALVSKDSDKLQQAAFRSSPSVSSSTCSVFNREIECAFRFHSMRTSGKRDSAKSTICMAIKRSSFVTTTVSLVYPLAEIISVSGKTFGRTSSNFPSSFVSTFPPFCCNRTTAKFSGFRLGPSEPNTTPFN